VQVSAIENLKLMDRVFTEDELKKYNGSRKMPVYIAYNGLVYDVTSSPHWQGGEHWNLHYSGIDLTDELPDSPHGERVFMKFPVVGRLQE
jgi:predicted heme/steroid binding protein